MVKCMVITRVKKGKQYAGSWHKDKASAIKFAKQFKKKGIPFIITTTPQKRYEF